jgi:eukaryotic-like serine/threonine-protein kinase
MAGQLLSGRYELGHRIGVGGMSTVMLATDRRLEREVAIKLLAEHLAEDSQFVTRFRREALNVAGLVHPNIVQVFDFGYDEAGGRHYIVMEYVRGRSGAELLKDEGKLSVPATLAIVTQGCHGLDYAHRNGVVHRDVKPGNLLRAEDGTVKLADFGIAKALHEQSSITQVGSVLGTAAYLAPEQAHGEPAGPPADLYALGVVTYQLLSGRLPYEAQSLTELAFKQQRELPPLLHEVAPGVSPELAAAVQRAMALEPADRYADAEEMRQALVDGVRGVGPSTTATQAVHRTAATSVLGGGGQAAAPEPVRRRVPREPRAAPAPAGGRTEAAPAPAPSRRERRAERTAAAPPRAGGPVSARASTSDRSRVAGRPGRTRRRRGVVRRTLRLLFVLLLLGAGAAAAYVATSSDGSAVELRDVVYDDAQRSIDALKQLVDENTR